MSLQTPRSWANLKATQVRNSIRAGLEAGTEVDIVDECWLLADSHGWLILLFYTTQDYLSMSGTAPSRLSPPISIITQK